MTATTSTSVTGVLTASLVNSAQSSSSASSSTVANLQGYLANYNGSNSDTGKRIALNGILMTPNAGVAGQVAEKLLNDMDIVDPTAKALAIIQDSQALNTAITTMAHSSGILSNLLASIGL